MAIPFQRLTDLERTRPPPLQWKWSQGVCGREGGGREGEREEGREKRKWGREGKEEITNKKVIIIIILQRFFKKRENSR